LINVPTKEKRAEMKEPRETGLERKDVAGFEPARDPGIHLEID
jgi:hypothetical protein